MKQYTQSSSNSTVKPVDTMHKGLTESQQKIHTLENRVRTLQSTVELQSRQIRRLESSLQLLEALANRKI